MLNDLEHLLNLQSSEEDKLRQAGQGYVITFGTHMRRATGSPWSKRAAIRGRLLASEISDISAGAQRLIERAPAPWFEEVPVERSRQAVDQVGTYDGELFLSVIKSATGSSTIPYIGNYAISERQSTSGFLPGSTRALSSRSRFIVRSHELELSDQQLFSEAAVVGLPAQILRRLVASQRCHGAILWYFDSRQKRFTSIASSGVRGHTRQIVVPLEPEISTRAPVGIIALLRPEVDLVVYDESDRNVWQPKGLNASWGPRDRGLYKANSWNSCIGIPLLTKGYMVGALSLYSRSHALGLLRAWSEIDGDFLSACLQGYLRSFEEESRLRHAEQLFAEELSRTTTSLAVIGHVHDLAKWARATRAPLRLASNLLEANHRAESLKSLRMAIDASQSLVELAEQLRKIAKTAVHEPTRLEVDEVITNLLPLLELQTKNVAGERAHLDLSLPQAARNLSYSVFVDPLKLERVLLNLVDNAAFWAAENGDRSPTVWLRAMPVAKDMGATGVTLEVEDHGPGVPPDVRPHIWDRFYTTRSDQGTGLGLWLVRKFVSEMNGTVSLDSKPGRTVFRIVIPLSDGG